MRTYIKTIPEFNGLKLSLLTEKRIKLSKIFPDKKNIDKIKKIKITLKSNDINKHPNYENEIFLSENLTSIIGNRSSGKSLFLQSCFGSSKDGKIYNEKKFKKYFGNSPKLYKNNKNIIFYDFQNKEIPKQWIDENVKFYSQDELIDKFFTEDIYSSYKHFFDDSNEKIYEACKTENISKLKNLFSKINNNNSIEDKYKISEIKKEIFDTFSFKPIKNEPSIAEVDTEIQKIILHINNLKAILDNKIFELHLDEKIFLNNFIKRIEEILTEKKEYKIFLNSSQTAAECFKKIIKTNLIGKITDDFNKMKVVDEELTAIENETNSIIQTIKKFPISENREYQFILSFPVKIGKEIMEKFKQNIGLEENVNLKDKIISIQNNELDIYVENLFEFNWDLFFYKNSNNYIEKEDIKNMSEGRKALAILEVLLSNNNMKDKIIIIDQPEDNVDNNDIYNIIVKEILLKNNSDKQIIFSSHNANIVINGDSENIIFTKKVDNNFLINNKIIEEKECIKELCSLLEGGKYAFEKRGMKYGK